ncbi:uncharacterized protein LOC142229725 [Haematobia irritans]|uniref:uncharacterized protein LOC142229725 n=1 Tax=Haematobia irritans TaxID=7368 RepID=UPI003F4FAD6F
MPLEAADLEALARLLKDALQSTAVRAAADAAANISQGVGTVRTAVAPPVSIPPFKPSDTASLLDYFTRCEWSLGLSKIAEADYKRYVLVHMGTELNEALKILISPKTSDDLTYDEVKKTLVDHFDGRKNQYAESIKFRQVTQEAGQSLSNFELRLRQAAAFCNYGTFLDRMLTEQLLFGLSAREICDEIRAKEPSNFNEAYEIAQRLEASHRTVMEMRNATTTFSVSEGEGNTNRVGYESFKYKGTKPRVAQERNVKSEEKFNRPQCYGCGAQHNRDKCKFRNAICFPCKRTGHIARVCKTRTSCIFDDDVDDSSELVQRLNQLKGSQSGRHMIEIFVNGNRVVMELDTGAPCAIISMRSLREIMRSPRIQETNRRFTSYTGNKIVCLGRVVVNARVGASTKRLNLYVVEGDFDSLFGREWIQQFVKEIDFVKLFSTSGQIKSIKTLSPVLPTDESNELLNVLRRFDDVFSETAGKLQAPPIRLHLKPNSTPVFARAREIPLALKDEYAAEIDRKIAAGLFERVDYSEWASTTHVVSKKNGKIRITGNYKPTVNPQIIIDEHPITKPEYIFNKMKGSKVFCPWT